jgi:hypothetical protein
MVATVPFADKIGFDKTEPVGFTVVVLSSCPGFFGVRSNRDNVGNGEFTFSKGFGVGISDYPDFVAEKLKTWGASPAAIPAQLQKLKKYRSCPTPAD